MVDVIGRAKVIVESDVDSTQVSSIGTKLGGLLSGALKTGAIGAAAGIGAAISGVIFKGFQRLEAIDQAQAKLKGLGNSTKDVAAIMKNALSAVKGTAFGLGDAATVAAQLVAAGAKPGKALADQLKSVANLAAGAGISLSEMGSIYAKAMTQANGVQNDVLGQLQDRGLPIYQKLAEQLGVTSGEVFKLASNGQISFEQFSAAAAAAGGTVADEMGNTVSGALDNLGAAVGRLGAAFLGESFKTFPGLLKAITEKLDELEPWARKVGQDVRDIIDAIERWAKSKQWQALQDSMKSWGKDLKTVSGFLGSIVEAMFHLSGPGQGKGFIDFLIKLEEHTTPLRVIADIIRTIEKAASSKVVSDFLSKLSNFSGGGIGSILRASGGPASGWTVVGERGPELLNLPNGSYVRNANDTKDMLGGGTTNVFNISTLGVSDSLLAELDWWGRFKAPQAVTVNG